MMARLRPLVAAALATIAFPAVAPAQSLVIRRATIHTLAGPDITGGTVVVTDGRITAVGRSVTVPAGARIIEGAGLHVYPGFFDALSQLGLTEIGDVAVTADSLELGTFNPHLLGAAAVHPPSEHIPVARVTGITHAVAAPRSRAGGVGGQASLVNLNGWTVEDMLVSPSVGFVFTWPSIVGGRPFADAKRDYDAAVRQLAGWIEDARRYDTAAKAGQAARDLKLEAFSRLTRKELPLLVSVNTERYIRDAIAFAATHDIRFVILGGAQAWKVRTELAKQGIPVVLGPTQALPSGPDEPYDEQYAAPGLLHQAGVRVAFASFGASDSRTLPFQAGNAVSYGLPADEALKAITVRAAEILGVADKIGTIAPGRIANLIVTTGDPLEYRTDIRHVIIAGQDVALANRHLQLYEKYRSRPRPVGAGR